MGALPPYPRPRREAEGQGGKDPLPLCFSGYLSSALSRPSRYAVPLRGSLDRPTGSAGGKVFSAHQRERFSRAALPLKVSFRLATMLRHEWQKNLCQL